MRAAVVTTFDAPPQAAEHDEPTLPPTADGAPDPDAMIVDVLAAGLHPRVRSQASGSHYTSTEELPLVPGVDGVGRGPDGLLRYFVLPDTTMGSMAERTVIDVRRSIVLPEGTDPVAVAAAMNPAMSSWIALRHRTAFAPGQDVLVLGATGSAGAMALRVAALGGARRLVAAGRDAGRLAALPGEGATDTVLLDDDADATAARLADAARDVDVVLDYVWGAVTTTALTAIVTARTDRSKPLTWIEIGSVAGPDAAIPSAALRAAKLQIVGSGQGSVTTREIVGALPGIAAAIADGSVAVDARAVPLADVATAWAESGSRERLVIVP